jgi:hypothetical protein
VPTARTPIRSCANASQKPTSGSRSCATAHCGC